MTHFPRHNSYLLVQEGMGLRGEEPQPHESPDDVSVSLVPQGAPDDGAGLADPVQLAVDRGVPDRKIIR